MRTPNAGPKRGGEREVADQRNTISAARTTRGVAESERGAQDQGCDKGRPYPSASTSSPSPSATTVTAAADAVLTASAIMAAAAGSALGSHGAHAPPPFRPAEMQRVPQVAFAPAAYATLMPALFAAAAIPSTKSTVYDGVPA